MGILYSQFLFFLPLVIIPLILSLQMRLNKVKYPFSSLMLLEDILKTVRYTQKKRSVLRQIIRFFIMLFLVFAFAGIYNKQLENRSYVLLVDPSLSMSVQPLKRQISEIRNRFNITDVYLGHKEWDFQNEEPVFLPEQKPLEVLMRTIPPLNTGQGLIYLTDGQKYQFENKVRITHDLMVILVTNSRRNIYVSQCMTEPVISLPQIKTDIHIELAGEIRDNDRIEILLNDKIVFEAQAREKISLTRYIESKGLNHLLIRLQGDEVDFDNQYFFPLIQSPVPRVYIDQSSPVLSRSLQTIFPRINYQNSPQNSDLVFDSGGKSFNENSHYFIFPDDPGRFEDTIRKLTARIPLNLETQVRGSINSEYPVLGLIGEQQLKLKYGEIPGLKQILIGDQQLITEINNISIFHFSLRENEVAIQNSLFLLFYINEMVNRTWYKRYLNRDLSRSDTLIDKNGKTVKPGTPGIYQLKGSPRFSVVNIGQESLWEFYNADELSTKIDGKARIITFKKITEEKIARKDWFPAVLMILILILMVWDSRT